VSPAKTPKITKKDQALLLVSMASMSDAEALRKLRATFHVLLIGEIRRVLEHEVGVAAMILCCCALDFLGSLHAGTPASGQSFRSFVNAFLPEYDPAKLWLLRNRLVHNYMVPPGTYSFTVGRQNIGLHATAASDGGAGLIIVDQLADDIQQAGERLLRHARLDPAIRQHVLARIRKRGLIWMIAFSPPNS
jgi:hypothetical protein